jgi:hypothetical protein
LWRHKKRGSVVQEASEELLKEAIGCLDALEKGLAMLRRRDSTPGKCSC